MNLLAKRAKWLLLSVVILTWGCKEDVGVELPPDVQRTEVTYMEFALPITNIYFDSLRTSGRGVTFLGQYSDEIYGSITSSVFTEFRYKDGLLSDSVAVDRGEYDEIITDLVYEAVSLNFEVFDALAGSNAVTQEVLVSTLADTIFTNKLYERDDQISTVEVVGTGSLNLLSLDTIDFSSGSEHVTSIVLSEDYGKFIMETFEEDGTAMQPLGLKIESTTSDGILSFNMNNDASELIIQMRGNLYDTLGNLKKDTVITAVAFNYNGTTSDYFSNIERDRSGTVFNSATDKTEINPSGDFVYYNLLAGIHPKIDLSPVIDFATSHNNVVFNQATLDVPTQTNEDFVPSNDFTQMYFGRAQEENVFSIYWPQTLTSPDFFGTIMHTDGGYTRSAEIARFINTTIDSDLDITGFSGAPVIFFQHIYDNTQDDLNDIAADNRPVLRNYLSGVDNLILIPGQFLVLGQDAIDKESVTLKVFYTQLKQ